jgi:hypothetical protein
LFKLRLSPADKVAHRSTMKGKVVAIEGLLKRLTAFSVRLGPRALARQVTRWTNKTSWTSEFT